MIETVILFPTYIHVSYVVASKFQVLGWCRRGGGDSDRVGNTKK